LREGLLAPGTATSANQALYGNEHVERIRIVRSLSKVAKLPLATIREVLNIVDGGGNAQEAMGRTQEALVGETAEDAESEDGLSAAQELLDAETEKPGWRAYKQS